MYAPLGTRVVLVVHTLPWLALLARSGVYNDLGSGSNIDLCIISGAGVEYLRNHEYLQGKTYARQFPVKYAPGTAREWHQHAARLSAERLSAGRLCLVSPTARVLCLETCCLLGARMHCNTSVLCLGCRQQLRLCWLDQHQRNVCLQSGSVPLLDSKAGAVVCLLLANHHLLSFMQLAEVFNCLCTPAQPLLVARAAAVSAACPMAVRCAAVLKEKVSLSQVAVIEGVESMDTDS